MKQTIFDFLNYLYNNKEIDKNNVHIDFGPQFWEIPGLYKKLVDETF